MTRKSTGKRMRFEIFKRDNFACRYCGRTPPSVVLVVDHIIPVSKGGGDDEMNLATACFDCNAGKTDKVLTQQITGSDPTEKTAELKEKRDQLKHYYKYQGDIRRIKDNAFYELILARFDLRGNAENYLRQACEWYSVEDVAYAFQLSINKTDGYEPKCSQYFHAILRNWRNAGGRVQCERNFLVKNG